jgi:hypothetical protein
MANRTITINETRLAFIAGVTLAAKTPAEAEQIFTDLNIPVLDLGMAEAFHDSFIAEIKENKQPEPKARKKRSDTGVKKAYHPAPAELSQTESTGDTDDDYEDSDSDADDEDSDED